MQHLRGSNVIGTLGLAFLAGACDVREPFPERQAPMSATIYAINDNAHDVGIYVLRAGHRYGVAQISGGGAAYIEIGEALLAGGELTLLAVADSGQTYQTLPISIVGRLDIDLTIRPVFSESGYHVSYDDGLDSATFNQEYP